MTSQSNNNGEHLPSHRLGNYSPIVQRLSIVHYALRASVIVFVCTGARLVFSGVLLFSRQACNCVKEIITPRASGFFKLAILKYVFKCCLINKVHE